MDCVGTRYHPRDQYQIFLNQKYTTYDENDEVTGEEYIWDSYMRVVETNGDFLWPRDRRDDGKAFGFNASVLAHIKGEYEDRTQFYSQYYNNPNDPGNAMIGRDKFQYYDKTHLHFVDGAWQIHGERLSVFAGLDFAFSLNKKADSTCLVVVGVDSKNNYYVLDIHRIKSDRISDYFSAILETYSKWEYRKIRCEVTVAQQVIVRDLKDNYIRVHNLPVVVDEYRPTRHHGNKEERVNSTLQPKYDNQQVWHFKGGECENLEEELVLAKPPHDDIKDALTAAIDIAVPPMRRSRGVLKNAGNVLYHSRFGGMSYK